MIPRAVSPARASTCAAGPRDARLALLLARGTVVDRMTLVSTSPMRTKTWIVVGIARLGGVLALSIR